MALKSPNMQRQAWSRETTEGSRLLKAAEEPSLLQARLAPTWPLLPPWVTRRPWAVAGELRERLQEWCSPELTKLAAEATAF